MSFSVAGHVYVASPSSGEASCVAQADEAEPIVWGPRGDRLLIAGFGSVEVVTGHRSTTVNGPGDTPRLQGFSRPSGANVLFVSSDGTKLVKAPVDGGPADDISFLRRHDEAAYHPSGAQIAVIGQSANGDYGIWLADNEGQDAREIVPVDTEDEFYGLAYSDDGSTLYYVADEHDSWELRAYDLTGGGAAPEKLLAASTPIAAPLVSPLSAGLVAYRQGDCDSGFTTYVHDARGTRPQAEKLGDTEPVGWLPDGSLVLATSHDLCDPARKLDLYVSNHDEQSVVVKDVSQAAVRVALPPPPPVPSSPAGDPTGE